MLDIDALKSKLSGALAQWEHDDRSTVKACAQSVGIALAREWEQGESVLEQAVKQFVSSVATHLLANFNAETTLGIELRNLYAAMQNADDEVYKSLNAMERQALFMLLNAVGPMLKGAKS